MGKSYVKFLELAQLCRSKAYMETDDFWLWWFEWTER